MFAFWKPIHVSVTTSFLLNISTDVLYSLSNTFWLSSLGKFSIIVIFMLKIAQFLHLSKWRPKVNPCDYQYTQEYAGYKIDSNTVQRQFQ